MCAHTHTHPPLSPLTSPAFFSLSPSTLASSRPPNSLLSNQSCCFLKVNFQSNHTNAFHTQFLSLSLTLSLLGNPHLPWAILLVKIFVKPHALSPWVPCRAGLTTKDNRAESTGPRMKLSPSHQSTPHHWPSHVHSHNDEAQPVLLNRSTSLRAELCPQAQI